MRTAISRLQFLFILCHALKPLTLTPRHSSPTGPQFAIWDADHSNTITEDEYIKFCKEQLDNNQRHEVVFKFMKNKDQFDREIDARKKVSMT